MIKIDDIEIKDFSIEEFPENPIKYASKELLIKDQQFRTILGASIFPSKAKGALARFNGRKTSRHRILYDPISEEIIKKSDANDVFCNAHIFKAWIIALSLFSGIGVYFDTNGNNGKPWPMLHLDLRHSPLIWYRNKGKYFYPYMDDFYKNLQNLFVAYGIKDNS